MQILGAVHAGFPSPAEDYMEKQINLDELLVRNRVASYLLRVEGDSMIGAAIKSGDLVLVDKSITAYSGAIVVACINGEFTLKRYKQHSGKIWLHPENKEYQEIEIKAEDDFVIFGVVTAVIRSLNRALNINGELNTNA
jgi:DNA polymerase V